MISEPEGEPLTGVVVSLNDRRSHTIAHDLPLPGAARPADVNPYNVYLASLAKGNSRRTTTYRLDQVACLLWGIEHKRGNCGSRGIGAHFPWEMLRFQHTSAIRAEMISQGWSPSRANACLSAMRKTLRTAWKLQLMSSDDYQLAREVKDVKGTRVPAGRSIHPDEMAAMLKAALAEPNDPAGIRDAALISLLWSTGAREAEAAATAIEHYDAGRRRVKLLGKGNKERYVYLHTNAALALQRWLAFLNARSGPIFRKIDKHGHISPKAIAPCSVYYIVNRRRLQAGLASLTPHDFRHTFIGDILDAGAHLPQAQELAGHESVNTTAAYVRHDEGALRDAVDRLPIPDIMALAGAAQDGAE